MTNANSIAEVKLILKFCNKAGNLEGDFARRKQAGKWESTGLSPVRGFRKIKVWVYKVNKN